MVGGATLTLVAHALVLRCHQCGQANRVPVGRLYEGGRCGACKAPLAAPDQPVEISDEELEGLLAEAPVPVVVDFWAPWCGPCRMIGPTLEDAARKLQGRLLIAKLNVDDNPQGAARHDARSIPLLVGFSGGKAVQRQVGALPPAALLAWLQKLLA